MKFRMMVSVRSDSVKGLPIRQPCLIAVISVRSMAIII